ncbi:MAG: hypothetical protein ACREQD_15605, partial [Candidatus Binataceae bacterium]
VLTTLLVRKEQIQQSHLVDHITAFDAYRLGMTPPTGRTHFNYMSELVTGQKQGLSMLYGSVQSQAAMLSLNNIYRSLSVVMILAILLCILLPRTHGRAPAAAH